MKLQTCVTPSGKFIYGIHKPHFQVRNFRELDHISALGEFSEKKPHLNAINFPPGILKEKGADWIFEIRNSFPFRGTTYIVKSWADKKATNPISISLPLPPQVSLAETVDSWFADGDNTEQKLKRVLHNLPEPLVLALAATSTDVEDLKCLAELSCKFVYNPSTNRPTGLIYRKDGQGKICAAITNPVLFETLVNNLYLPDDYKEVMILRPGVQGSSEIVGDWINSDKGSHIFEYLRRNSYIPWGHYAANMANDTIRYRLEDLSLADMTGLRHLYYQRTFVRIAEQCDIALLNDRLRYSPSELEELRQKINRILVLENKRAAMQFNRSLWGWNFGFDFSPSGYRLHASHQQIHQQFALIPSFIPIAKLESQEQESEEKLPSYASGDLISSFVKDYRVQTGKFFFDKYIHAIRTNTRMDNNREGESSLIVYEDTNVMIFVPKAQTSQWELQLMTLKPVGNVLEAGSSTRNALDRAILIAVKILSALGGRMISTIEYSKSFDSSDTDQRMLYAFLPKLPESPGAFSEAQLRWINGHYPEDFAIACRTKLPEVLKFL